MENSKKANSKSKSIKTSSKSNSKSKSRKENSKSKSSSSSSTKSSSKPLTENGFMMRLLREHGELDESYRQRIEFVKKIVAEKKVQLTAKMVPFVSTMSFVHVYKKSGMYGYPKEVEIAYQKLLWYHLPEVVVISLTRSCYDREEGSSPITS